MQTYFTNKISSFMAVLACIIATYAISGSSIQQWQAILLAIIIFGYGHFLLGFYYQLKSFFRKPHPWRYVTTFIFLVLTTVIFAVGVMDTLGFVTALFIGFLYFLLHGLFNERTLLQRQTGHVLPLSFLAALAVFVIALLTYSIPDQTFFFDRNLSFTVMNEFLITYTFEVYYMSLANFSYIYWIGSGISVAILSYAWFKHGYNTLSAGLLAVIGATSLAVVIFGPPPYIYMYLLVVGYHFVTWLLFYLVEMKRRGKKIYRTFVLQNISVLIPFLVGAYLFFTPNTPVWVMWIFDYQLFLVMTYIHISTSFMNDQWLIDLQDRFYR